MVSATNYLFLRRTTRFLLFSTFAIIFILPLASCIPPNAKDTSGDQETTANVNDNNRMFTTNFANAFLDYFFKELENRLDNVL